MINSFSNQLPYCYQNIEYSFSEYVREKIDELNLTEDDSEYNVVDCEEGDNGKIRYYLKSGELFCTYINQGGDNDDYEYSELAKVMLKSWFIQFISTYDFED